MLAELAEKGTIGSNFGWPGFLLMEVLSVVFAWVGFRLIRFGDTRSSVAADVGEKVEPPSEQEDGGSQEVPLEVVDGGNQAVVLPEQEDGDRHEGPSEIADDENRRNEAFRVPWLVQPSRKGLRSVLSRTESIRKQAKKQLAEVRVKQEDVRQCKSRAGKVAGKISAWAFAIILTVVIVALFLIVMLIKAIGWFVLVFLLVCGLAALLG